jgi:hypothetical protein
MTSAISHQDLSDLIGRIYDCTLDPSRWEATLDAIRTLLRADEVERLRWHGRAADAAGA